jgi:hypothetical protein
VTRYPYGGGTGVAQARATLGSSDHIFQEQYCMKALAHVGFVVILAGLSGSIACGGNKTPTQPPAPVHELKTAVFTGTVVKGGSTPFMFTIVNPGEIQVAITELGPTSTLTMGILLGFWEAATQTCVEQARTTTATVNVVYTANPSSPGEYCAAVFDSGNVVVTSDFKLTVTHY